MSVRNFVYSKDLERSCGQYSVTNCRCDVSSGVLRTGSRTESKIFTDISMECCGVMDGLITF